jgi:ATP-binding cassette subfamily B protein
MAVLEKVSLIKFIDAQPEGLQTKVGERGTRLSGGERQRLGIARALVRKVDILLLDEATSALDNHTERAIQSTLEESFSGVTKLVIAHRLTTIMKSDLILVLSAGNVVQSGGHDELLQRSGPYKALWDNQ